MEMHKKSIFFVIFQLIVKFLCSFQIYLIILSCEKLPYQALEVSSSALTKFTEGVQLLSTSKISK